MQYQIENFGLVGYVDEKQKDGKLLVATKDFLHSEKEPMFSRFLEGIRAEILDKINSTIKPSQIDNLLVIINTKNQANVIINELKIKITGYPKTDIKVGDHVTENDIAHINFANIVDHKFAASDRFIFLFNIGWQRGVCFDLTPRDSAYTGLSEEEFSKWLGQSSYLGFKRRFDFSEGEWEYCLNNSFFPFIYLDKDLIHILVNLAKENSDNFDELYMPHLLKVFNDDLTKLAYQWQKNPIIKAESKFIDIAIKHYKEEDYISCISVIYPRIEKILRLHSCNIQPHLTTLKKKSLSNSIQINFDKTEYPYTPLLTERFTTYLENWFFKDFMPGKFGEPINRNTVSHGVASEQAFNRKFSVIAFMIINQLYYYLGSDGRTCTIDLE